LKETNIEPILVFQIDGIDTLYGSKTIKKVARYGDENLFYDNPVFVYGGLVALSNQEPLITLDGTTTSIKQNLAPDKARGTGITSMSIVLVDIDGKATKLASGQFGEILFRRCKVWAGFGENSSFTEDFILLFRGVIESIQIEQGKVKFNLSSPDQKRRVLLLPKGDTKLNGAINNSQTTITLESVENFFVVPDHPAYSPKDDDVLSYVKIEDEIIRYTGISGNTLTGCTRGEFFTTAVGHADQAQAETFFKVEGNAMELALKVMLSDEDQTPYISSLEASAVNQLPSGNFPNSIYFGGINFEREFNVRIGDFVQTSGFTQVGNNFSSWAEIVDVVILDTGSYVVVDQTLTDEPTATGTVDFLSRFNSLGKFGMGLNTDEVDIARHDFLRRNFLFNFDYRFFVKDEIEDGKEWVEAELYRPASCYSLPADRGGLSRLSVGLHIAPLPNENIVTISQANVTKPDRIGVKRSVNKNYYNSILTRFEDTPDEERFFRKVFTVSGTPFLPEVKGNKTLVIDSKGLKDDLSASTLASAANSRLLSRYESAAEYIDGLEILFSSAVTINVGDIIIFDPTGLNVVNQLEQNRARPPGLWEVVNKDLNLKGQAKIDLVNTAFNIDARYGLWSAASRLRTIISQTRFVIEGLSAFPKFGNAAEYRKWENIENLGVKIRSSDWSNVFQTVLIDVSFNTLTVRDAAPFPLTAGMVLELSNYDFAETTEQQKLVYVHWTDDDNDFADGGKPYVWI